MNNKPLLSISIPTYNRAERLEKMLECLIPQAGKFIGEVEIVINDNASEDNTRQIVQRFSELYPICYFHNGINIGGILNIVMAGAGRIQGEFVWILGDDDLLNPGALANVVEKLKNHNEYDLFMLNTQNADYNLHWPVSTYGGYQGEFLYLLNQNLTDTKLSTWEESLLPTNGFGTQIYTSIVRSCFWKDYWIKRRIELAVFDEHDVFPHSIFIARTFLNKPCYYIGQPVVTIFDGGQSWLSISNLIILDKVPRLLDIYYETGVSHQKVNTIRKFVYLSWCHSNLEDNFRNGRLIAPSWMFLKNKLLSPLAWYTWLRVLVKTLLVFITPKWLLNYFKRMRKLFK